jgi:predicted ABC-type ATPase
VEKEIHPNLYVIAGPNGAGKTTFAREFLPHFARCPEFVNADLIATGLSPFAPRTAAIEAGRTVLRRIHELARRRLSFGFETTLSGKNYLNLLRGLKADGYRIHLFYLWLPGVGLAIRRVQDRVKAGGHSVPEEDIRRRFYRGLMNLKVYRKLLDSWVLFDNSGVKPRVVAFEKAGNLTVLDIGLYENMRTYLEGA